MGSSLMTYSAHRKGLVLSSNFPNMPRWVNSVVFASDPLESKMREGGHLGIWGVGHQTIELVFVSGDITGPVQTVLPMASFLVRIHFNGTCQRAVCIWGMCACGCVRVCACV